MFINRATVSTAPATRRAAVEALGNGAAAATHVAKASVGRDTLVLGGKLDSAAMSKAIDEAARQHDAVEAKKPTNVDLLTSAYNKRKDALNCIQVPQLDIIPCFNELNRPMGLKPGNLNDVRM